MLKKLLIAGAALSLIACSQETTDGGEEENLQTEAAETAEAAPNRGILPDVPKGTQAVSLLGTPLEAPVPRPDTVENLRTAEAEYQADPMDAENIIWYGRRAAYTGDYRRAIEIFSEGIEKHPEDSRMYRHRGHRYITIRELDRAIADYELASKLIEGQEDSIEPDGAPNSAGIPVSSRHGNIWYHLGLAHYLKHDWEKALRAYQMGQNLMTNDDNTVSTAHWIYMILRRMGRDDEAAASLERVSKDMNVIENHAYHRLVLFYKGELTLEEMLSSEDGTPQGSAVKYGIANWHYSNGDTEKAYDLMEDIVLGNAAEGYGWGAFGFIAAEADLQQKDKTR